MMRNPINREPKAVEHKGDQAEIQFKEELQAIIEREKEANQ